MAHPETEAEADPAKNQIAIMRAVAGLDLDQAFIRELAASPLTLAQINFAAGATLSQHAIKNKPGYFRGILENDCGYRKPRRRA